YARQDSIRPGCWTDTGGIQHFDGGGGLGTRRPAIRHTSTGSGEEAMRTFRMNCERSLAALLAWSCLVSQVCAQEAPQIVERPHAPVLWRPYLGATVPPVRLTNSSRLYSLMRAGKLYLTVQDAIALAIENNLDLEVNRYGPVTAEWNLARLRAGGALAGVTAGNTLVNLVTSGQGVAGSQLSAGLLNAGGGNGTGGANALVSQVGPITPNLDPVL